MEMAEFSVRILTAFYGCDGDYAGDLALCFGVLGF